MTGNAQRLSILRLISKGRKLRPRFDVVDLKANPCRPTIAARPFIAPHHSVPKFLILLSLHFSLPQICMAAAPVAIMNTACRIPRAAIDMPEAVGDGRSVAWCENPTAKGFCNFSSLAAGKFPPCSSGASLAGSGYFASSIRRFGWIGSEVGKCHAAGLGTERAALPNVVLPALFTIRFKATRHN